MLSSTVPSCREQRADQCNSNREVQVVVERCSVQNTYYVFAVWQRTCSKEKQALRPRVDTDDSTLGTRDETKTCFADAHNSYVIGYVWTAHATQQIVN